MKDCCKKYRYMMEDSHSVAVGGKEDMVVRLSYKSKRQADVIEPAELKKIMNYCPVCGSYLDLDLVEVKEEGKEDEDRGVGEGIGDVDPKEEELPGDQSKDEGNGPLEESEQGKS